MENVVGGFRDVVLLLNCVDDVVGDASGCAG